MLVFVIIRDILALWVLGDYERKNSFIYNIIVLRRVFVCVPKLRKHSCRFCYTLCVYGDLRVLFNCCDEVSET